MERQVRTVLDNFGLIVVGYAGGDDTIMQLLEEVSEHNGLYWCYIKDNPPGEDVLKLVKSKNGKLVEITGFDDMMKKIADVTNFSIDDLLASFERRKTNLVERITKFNDDYTKKSLGEYADELTEKQKDQPAENLSAVHYLVLGNKAYNDNNLALAEENYRKAIKLNPDYSTAYWNLGDTLAKSGILAEAEENYRKAIELNPQSAEAFYNFANLLAKNKERWDEAEQNYRKAIELNPDYGYIYYSLGVLFQKQNRFTEAIEAFQQRIKLDKTNVVARISLAAIYKRLGNPDKSAEYVGEAEAFIKDDDYYNLACLYSVVERKDKALRFLRQAVAKDPFDKFKAKSDPDFDSIRDDEVFKQIVGGDE
jgi:tetratricopeptide (TPR) repeat protein